MRSFLESDLFQIRDRPVPNMLAARSDQIRWRDKEIRSQRAGFNEAVGFSCEPDSGQRQKSPIQQREIRLPVPPRPTDRRPQDKPTQRNWSEKNAGQQNAAK